MIKRLFEAVAKRSAETGEPISDADLARAAGVKQAAVSYWRDHAATSLKSEHVFRLADYLHVDTKWLVTGEPKISMLKDVGINPGANVTDPDSARGIPALVRRLQNLHTELEEILAIAKGLPLEALSYKSSDDVHVSSIRHDVEATKKLVRGAQQRTGGEGNVISRNKKPSSGGGKN